MPSAWMAEPEAVLLTVEAIMAERGQTAAKQRAEQRSKAAGTQRRRPGRRA